MILSLLIIGPGHRTRPTVMALYMNPYHFLIVYLVTLVVGQTTPSVGINLYIMRQPIERTMVNVWPFIGILVLATAILVFVPSISTFLPSLIAR